MYSRKQEDGTERKLEAMGFELIEDTGRRKKLNADRIMEHKDTGLRLVVEHKSTRGKKMIQFQKEWVDKVRKEAESWEGLGVVTLSFFGSPKRYVVIDMDDLEGVMY